MSSSASDIVDQLNTIITHYKVAKMGAQVVHHVRKDHVPIHKHPEKKKMEKENLKKWGFSIIF